MTDRTGDAAQPDSTAAGRRRARPAAAVLVGLGVLFVAGGFAIVAISSPDTAFGRGFQQIGLIVAGVGGTHLLAGAGVWRGKTWGAALAAILSTIGLLAGLLWLAEPLWGLTTLGLYGFVGVMLVRGWQGVAAAEAATSAEDDVPPANH